RRLPLSAGAPRDCRRGRLGRLGRLCKTCCLSTVGFTPSSHHLHRLRPWPSGTVATRPSDGPRTCATRSPDSDLLTWVAGPLSQDLSTAISTCPPAASTWSALT